MTEHTNVSFLYFLPSSVKSFQTASGPAGAYSEDRESYQRPPPHKNQLSVLVGKGGTWETVPSGVFFVLFRLIPQMEEREM